ncbi:MAG TPA: hypothetical protein VGN69_07160 [Solirubrobacteraceae bacterium]|nr:hypothetical protein [Solirubrobacteraceae bacterium]
MSHRAHRTLATAVICAGSLGGCASPSGDAAAPGGQAGCAQTAAGALGTVLGRLYSASAAGSNVGEAIKRVQGSAPLTRAVGRGDRAATRLALNRLLKGQILRIRILRAGRLFVEVGSGQALGPSSGDLRGPSGRVVGRFILAVQGTHSFLSLARALTGVPVGIYAGGRLMPDPAAGGPTRLAASGPLTWHGQRFRALTLAATLYPSGPIDISMLVPSSGGPCGASTQETRALVLGMVARRIYQGELSGSAVQAAVRHVSASRRFSRAIARGDRAEARASIIAFFTTHLHVVRVRVLRGGRPLVDVGGPAVLAPVSVPIRRGGRQIGVAVIAVQDDAGYVKLVHRFTGAKVVLYRDGQRVMGTLHPGPRSPPPDGEVSYHGHSFRSYSFTGTAFPSGPLQISLFF